MTPPQTAKPGKVAICRDQLATVLDSQSAATFPPAGTGLNTCETAALVCQRHDLDKYFGEAQNDYLELAAGGGLLVGVPIVLTLLIFVRDVRRRMRDDPGSDEWWLRRGAVTRLVAIALHAPAPARRPWRAERARCRGMPGLKSRPIGIRAATDPERR